MFAVIKKIESIKSLLMNATISLAGVDINSHNYNPMPLDKVNKKFQACIFVHIRCGSRHSRKKLGSNDANESFSRKWSHN